MLTHARLAPVTLAIVVLACSGSDGVRHTAGTRAASDDAPAGEPAGAVSPGPPAVAPDTPSAATLIALDGDGLMLVDSSGSTRAVAFGASEAVVLRAATAAFGEPRDRSSNQECGAGPLEFVSFDGGLLVSLQRGKFVGWTVRRTSGRGPSTMSGIGLGSTRAELEAAYAAKVATSSLGVEFSAGGLSGVLASKASTAPITDLWAGANCIAR